MINKLATSPFPWAHGMPMQAGEASLARRLPVGVAEPRAREVLALLHRRGQLTRAEIARLTGQSQAAVSLLVRTLIEAGLVQESVAAPRGLGRPARHLGIAPSAWSVLSFEVVAGLLRLAVVAGDGSVLHATEQPLPTGTLGLHALVQRMLRMAAETDRGSAGPLLAASVSVSGVVHRGVVVLSAGLGLRQAPIAEPLAEELGVPVWLVNDMDARALAEHRYGAGQGVDHLVLVAVEPSGIGAGIVQQGRPFAGARGSAGELGHVTVERHGLACPCGKRGCLEVYGSENAIVSRSAHLLRLQRKRRPLVESPTAGFHYVRRQVEELWALAAADAGIRRIFEDAMDYLGTAVANLVTLFDPELVIVAGHLMKVLGPWGMRLLTQRVREGAFDPGAEHRKIVEAALGEESGMRGAAYLAVDRMLAGD